MTRIEMIGAARRKFRKTLDDTLRPLDMYGMGVYFPEIQSAIIKAADEYHEQRVAAEEGL